jgi:hypothetical protein
VTRPSASILKGDQVWRRCAAMASMCSIEMLHFGWRVKPLYIHPVYKLQLYSVEGSTGQTPTPLNRPLIPLSEHQKFMIFSKYLENSQNFTQRGKWPEKPESNISFSKLWCCCGQIQVWAVEWCGRLTGGSFYTDHRFQHESWESDVLNGIM